MYQDGTYARLNPTWHQEDSPWKAKQILRLFERNGVRPSSVCEVGCGAGEILSQLSLALNGDIRFVGYEISEQAFQMCLTRATGRLTFRHRDILEDSGALFDVLLAIDVFEHIDDYLGFLRRLRAKATLKVFHIPLELSVQFVLRGSPLITRRRSLGHLHHFTKDTALATLEDTGYVVLDHFYTGGSLELPNRDWRAKALALPRKLLFMINEDVAVRVLGGFSLIVLAE